MSITNYSELKESVARWLARSDLAADIPDFITLFETEVNVRLMLRKMETTLPLTTTLGVASIPADFQGWRHLGYANGTIAGDVDYVTPAYLKSAYPIAAAGVPRLWTIIGDNILVRPYDDTADALTLDYYLGVPALSDANPTNWLLTKLPGAYLAGALTEAYGFMKKPADMQTWGGRREGWLNSLEVQDFKLRGPSSIKVQGVTP